MIQFHDYRKQYGQVSWSWKLNRGGYFALSKKNVIFYHKFFTSGNPQFGSERDFIFRVEIGFDREPRFSWLTLELVNLFEGRWFYFWVKVWKRLNFCMIFNFGFRMTKASREFHGRTAAQALMRQRLHKQRIGGLNHAAELRSVGGNGRQEINPVV